MQRILPDRDQNEIEQLMDWIKSTSTSTPHNTYLQNLSNGVVFCRLMAKTFPGSLASVLIINRATSESDSMFNFMLLHAAFTKAKLPWNFDTDKLIAGNILEQLKLSKTLSFYRDAYNNPPKSSHKSRSKQSTRGISNFAQRCAAGELDIDIDIDIEEQATGSIDPLDVLQQSLEKLSNHDEPLQSTADCIEPQLNQQIEDLFISQQVAMTAISEGQQPPATPPPHNILCLCRQCIKNLANNPSKSNQTN